MIKKGEKKAAVEFGFLTDIQFGFYLTSDTINYSFT